MVYPVYTNGVAPAIDAGNLNSVNNVVQNILGNTGVPPSNASDVLTNLVTGGNLQASATGYTKLPGNIVIQWGSSTTSGAGLVTVTFPKAFGTCFQVLAQVNSTSLIAATVAVGAFTATTVNLLAANASAAGIAVSVSWIAIGV